MAAGRLRPRPAQRGRGAAGRGRQWPGLAGGRVGYTLNNVQPPFYAPGGALACADAMTGAAMEPPALPLWIVAAAAAAALAGTGPAWAAGDPAQYEEIVGREIAGLDRSIAGIREELAGLDEAAAGRAASREGGWAERRSQDRFDPASIRAGFLESEIRRIEGLKADLGGLDIVTALARGTADSVPSTEGMLFRVIVSPGAVTEFRHRPTGGISIELEQDGGTRTVHVGIPAGLPHPGSTLDPAAGHLLEPVAHLSNASDIGYARGECYTFVSATISDASSIVYNSRFASARSVAAAAAALHDSPGPSAQPRSEAHAKWLESLRPPAPAPLRPPVVSPAIPDGCGGVVLVPPFDPPLKQVRRDGILAGTAACNEGLVLHVRGGEEALCLRPGTLEKLLASGILELPEEEVETLELARRRL